VARIFFMLQESRFPARWSLSVLTITFAVLGLLVGVSLVAYHHTPPDARWLATGICAAVVLGTLPFSVRGYGLTAESLWIERWGWRHAIPLQDIVSAAADPEALRGSLRLWASGGLFGFFGIFWSRRLGVFRAYCTAPHRSVLIKLRDRTVVVSPENPEAFVAALENCGVPVGGVSRSTTANL
jgi:hypothetical protein